MQTLIRLSLVRSAGIYYKVRIAANLFHTAQQLYALHFKLLKRLYINIFYFCCEKERWDGGGIWAKYLWVEISPN